MTSSSRSTNEIQQQNIILLRENTDLLQRTIALKADREELLRTNTQLRDQILELQNNIDNLTNQNQELTRLNDALNLATNSALDRAALYKNQNYAEFEKWVDEIIFFGIFKDMEFNNIFFQNLINFIKLYRTVIKENRYFKKIYNVFLIPILAIPYNFITSYSRLRIFEYLLANIFLFRWLHVFYVYCMQNHNNNYIIYKV